MSDKTKLENTNTTDSISLGEVKEQETEKNIRQLKQERRKEMRRLAKEEKQWESRKPKTITITNENGEEVVIKVKKNKNKLSVGDVIFFILDYAFFVIFAIACLFPFYYLFINTISDAALVSSGRVNFYPRGITLQNYIALKSVNALGMSVIVSIARTVLGTALMVMASAFVGYLVTQKDMWRRSFWYRFLVVTMYFNAGLIPWYMNMLMLGMTDHFIAYILPAIVAPYNIILVKTYIESIPGELQESAYIDGASHLTVFWKIILPLSKPILATIAIFGAVGNWNSFQDSLVLMQNNDHLYTLQHRLYIYLNTTSNLGNVMNSAGSGSTVNYNDNTLVTKYTISMVSIIPILLVYPFMSKYFEEGIMLGAVKG